MSLLDSLGCFKMALRMWVESLLSTSETFEQAAEITNSKLMRWFSKEMVTCWQKVVLLPDLEADNEFPCQ